MKKWASISLVFLFVLSLVFVSAPKAVEASTSDPAPVQVASGGNWTSGKEFEVDLDAYPSPASWLELLSQGVKATSTGKLCHPFRGHFYHWKANIYKLDQGAWVKVTTTFGYQTNYESDYMACVQAKKGVTYAMFGFYDGPTEFSSTEYDD